MRAKKNQTPKFIGAAKLKSSHPFSTGRIDPSSREKAPITLVRLNWLEGKPPGIKQEADFAAQCPMNGS